MQLCWGKASHQYPPCTSSIYLHNCRPVLKIFHYHLLPRCHSPILGWTTTLKTRGNKVRLKEQHLQNTGCCLILIQLCDISIINLISKDLGKQSQSLTHLCKILLLLHRRVLVGAQLIGFKDRIKYSKTYMKETNSQELLLISLNKNMLFLNSVYLKDICGINWDTNNSCSTYKFIEILIS